jgi:hypothetical protein
METGRTKACEGNGTDEYPGCQNGRHKPIGFLSMADLELPKAPGYTDKDHQAVDKGHNKRGVGSVDTWHPAAPNGKQNDGQAKSILD